MDLLLIRLSRRVATAGVLTALLATSAGAQVDLRASVVELEWRTATGYERCAGVVTARRAQGLEVWTAGHCANHPFSVVRFFDGYLIFGSNVRVLERSETDDVARLFVPVPDARTLSTPAIAFARTPPPMGTTVTIIGHPVAALQAADQGRWTITYGRMGETEPDPETGAPQYEVYCARCGPGDSGSGVFDAAGHLIGIVYGVTEIENVAGGRLPDGLYADVVPAGSLR